ncbi:MAG: extracellular solute-binding protein [Bacillota bacterium]
MKNRIKLGIALLLSFSLLVAGCSSNGSGNNGNKPAEGGATNTPVAQEEPIEITFAASTWDVPSEDNNYVQKYLEEKYNVKIINMRVTDENFKLKIAANEIPDIFPHNPTETDMVNWAKQGVIASISVDEIKQYMPTYVADVESVDPRAWDISLIDGKNYGIPRVWLNGSTGFIPTYNNGWLKAIGYSEPPKTIEEFEDVLTKFRNNDPDGNGQKDTYGMSGRGKNARNQMFNEVYAAFGVNPYMFLEASDGTITWGGIMDESLEATKLLNKWYNAGLIDPEFMTDDNGLMGQKFNSKKIGMIDTNMYHHLYGAQQGFKDSGIEPAYGKGLIGPAGKPLNMSNGALQVPLMLGAQVEKDDKKRIKILQILEELVTNDETYLTTAFGEEGVSYEIKDGVPVLKAPYDTEADKRLKMGIGGFYNPLIERAVTTWKFHMPQDKLDFKAKLTDGHELITDVLGPTVLESKGKYFANLSALQDEFFTKAIIAKNAGDVDKLFADFKAQWLKAGGQEILDEANKVYQERQAAK